MSKITKSINNKRTRSFVVALLALTLIVVPFSFGGSYVQAAGDASFNLSPSSGSYTVGDTLVLSISETSASSDNTNAVQVNMSYPTSLLQYQSTALTGPFNLCGQNTGGGGAVNIGCAASSAQSGTQSIAQVTFSVVNNGTANVNMTSGSNIVNASGNVWNGVLPTASYTLNPVQTSSPPPSGGSGSGGGSTSGSGNGNSKSSGSTGSSSTNASKPTSDNSSISSTNSSTPTTSPTAPNTTSSSSSATKSSEPKSVTKAKTTTKQPISSTKLTSYIAAPIVLLILLGVFLIYRGYRLTLIAEKPFIKFYKKAEEEIEKILD